MCGGIEAPQIPKRPAIFERHHLVSREKRRAMIRAVEEFIMALFALSFTWSETLFGN
jgi:hypothetical protein